MLIGIISYPEILSTYPKEAYYFVSIFQVPSTVNITNIFARFAYVLGVLHYQILFAALICMILDWRVGNC